MQRALVIFVFVLGASVLCAAPTGTLKGTIRDATGAVIPNAMVELKNEATGVTQKTVSDSTGVYQFPSIAPATYTLTVSVGGFRTEVIRAVSVLVDQIVSV